MSTGTDPALTDAGKLRAEKLKEICLRIKISGLFFQRTPTVLYQPRNRSATILALKTVIYDPKKGFCFDRAIETV